MLSWRECLPPLNHPCWTWKDFQIDLFKYCYHYLNTDFSDGDGFHACLPDWYMTAVQEHVLSLRRFIRPFQRVLGHTHRRKWCLLYLRSLMSPLERKSLQSLAEGYRGADGGASA